MAITNTNAVRSAVTSVGKTTGPQLPGLQVSCGLKTEWQDVNTAPETADNSGSSVVNPGAITRSDVHRVYLNGFGTNALVRLKYDDALTVSADPVVQLFGFDVAGVVQPLSDSSGNHEKTMTTAASTDVTDGTFKYTVPVKIELDGCSSLLVAIKTALAGTGTKDNATIQVRLI